MYYKSIRPGMRKGDPIVCVLCQIKYTKNGDLFYKLSLSDIKEWKTLPQRKRPTASPIPLEKIKPLFSSRLLIERDRFKHLQSLKDVLPSDTYQFYDSLPSK